MSKTYITAGLRRMVSDRAQGCCEYCLIPETLALASYLPPWRPQPQRSLAVGGKGGQYLTICIINFTK